MEMQGVAVELRGRSSGRAVLSSVTKLQNGNPSGALVWGTNKYGQLRIAACTVEETPEEVRRLCEQHDVPCVPAEEPEPPVVELESLNPEIGILRMTRIDVLHGHPDSPGNSCITGDCVNMLLPPMASAGVNGIPFSIYQAAIAAGVPCCDPPSFTLTGYNGAELDVCEIVSLCPGTDEHGSQSEITVHYMPDGRRMSGWAMEDPAAIRRLAAENGVPCPAEEKREIVVDGPNGEVSHWSEVDAIKAVLIGGTGYLQLTGVQDIGRCDLIVATPLADLRALAALAGIDLPSVRVETKHAMWSGIERIECHWRDGVVCTGIIGDATSGPRDVWADLTPSQALSLCALAGWDEPKCVCVFTTPSGKPLELKPKDIRDVSWRRCQESAYLELRNMNPQERYIRESMGQVEQMLAAFEPETADRTKLDDAGHEDARRVQDAKKGGE